MECYYKGKIPAEIWITLFVSSRERNFVNKLESYPQFRRNRGECKTGFEKDILLWYQFQ